MTNQEILEKAIQKAIDGGWNEYGNMSGNPNAADYLLSYEEAPDTYTWLFSHDFAKALWGDGGKWITRHFTPTGLQLTGQEVPYWKVHLQQMVIADDPLAYLAENI